MNRLGKSLPPLASLLPFEATARLGSVSRAAQELHITQAAVSRQIRALEADLGVALFERRNRGVYLTESGRSLAYILGNALAGLANEADRLRGVAGTNQVVLLCQMCEAFHWLMPRLSSFHQQFPEIELKVATLLRPLAEYEGYFDVAMQSSCRDRGAHPLLFSASDEVFPVCSPSYLARMGSDALTLDQVQRCTLLLHQTVPQYELEWDTWMAAHGLELPSGGKSLSFDNYSLMLQAAVAGHGLAMGWRRTAEGMLARGELVAPFAETVVLQDALSVCVRHGQERRPEAQALAAWLKAQLS
ncbi:LysR family transcriptional regulator [Pseudomonas sp. SWI6]|uniref:LysR family transcriptional regulator n=1 Tax=Pseudomonas taiwanensis TaxID=470150 RepID=A0ABR6V9Y2_9PSED|nr:MULTISPECIES: LysR substrate-binding domain-containing protein [Pseudomonas]AGZ35277.1 LysR family transcriptional regulator [Pseudomonas sp. VLB120]AVD83255.1 LysR family transcriptional regulator [Pseudomonas sp. SWI6]AVD90448.1 LysR family transcriptional regulator [Pseudomonas sp. SWI44]MBC3477272.1 LysR family transcriptional regulator [Pseudomonas taiwanensis]MBC3491681.1 LysR family transcriptional regulator [Pseudomonas taiwanensis]